MATMVKFIKAANAGLMISPEKFIGAKINAAGRLHLTFRKHTDAATGNSLVDLNITDGADGVEQKRVFMAIANAFNPMRKGDAVEVADVLTGKFIHPDITGVQAVTL
tara:strand:+ start:74 stop:394 length:321 start_codon:yes stop_codon:yes gene_type:complete